MKIALFEAKCSDCGNRFAKPELGDFAYGQFLFTGERGTVYAYFDAIAHPVWKRLESAAPSLSDRAAQGSLIQAACAYFADPLEGQRLTNENICPRCLSRHLAFWEGKRTGEAEVPMASFEKFSSLTESEQLHEATMFYAKFMAQQSAARDRDTSFG